MLSRWYDQGPQNLEGLSTLLRLCCFPQYEEGSKIHFSNDSMKVMTGAFERTIYGAEKNHISHLLQAIELAALQWKPERDERIHKIFTLAIKGIDALKVSYATAPQTFQDSLSHYGGLLRDLCDPQSKAYEKLHSNQNLIDLVERLKEEKIWSPGEEKSYINLVEIMCDRPGEPESKIYRNGIWSMLQAKDTRMTSAMNKIATKREVVRHNVFEFKKKEKESEGKKVSEPRKIPSPPSSPVESLDSFGSLVEFQEMLASKEKED